jgi:hypothetical protein
MPAEAIAKPVPGRVMDSWVASMLVTWGSSSIGRPIETLRQELNDVAAELAGENPTPIEEMLASTVALAWFDLRVAEADAVVQRKLSNERADYAERRVDRAHRRLMSAAWPAIWGAITVTTSS